MPLDNNEQTDSAEKTLTEIKELLTWLWLEIKARNEKDGITVKY